ncbi:hypothetical protein Tco_0514246 [Tanacetum coccineum]
MLESPISRDEVRNSGVGQGGILGAQLWKDSSHIVLPCRLATISSGSYARSSPFFEWLKPSLPSSYDTMMLSNEQDFAHETIECLPLLNRLLEKDEANRVLKIKEEDNIDKVTVSLRIGLPSYDESTTENLVSTNKLYDEFKEEDDHKISDMKVKFSNHNNGLYNIVSDHDHQTRYNNMQIISREKVANWVASDFEAKEA